MERFTHTVNPDQVGKKVNGPVLALERADMTIVVDDRMPGTRLAMLSLYTGADVVREDKSPTHYVMTRSELEGLAAMLAAVSLKMAHLAKEGGDA